MKCRFVIALLVVASSVLVVQSSFCEKRDITELDAGQKCMKSCSTDADCRGKRRKCVCDGVCGMSCINQDWTCNRLPTLPNGRIVYSDRTRKYLSIARQLCDQGYTLSGESIRRCRSDGKYSGKSAQCVEQAASGPCSHHRCRNGGKCIDGTNKTRIVYNYMCQCPTGFIGRYCEYELTNWGSWSSCSQTCGEGTRKRSSICLSQYCTSRTQTEECNQEECPEPWGEWTEWGNCSVSCGVGEQNRTRSCLLDTGCDDEDGSNYETRECELPECEVPTTVPTTVPPAPVAATDIVGSGMQTSCSAPGSLWNGLVLGTSDDNVYTEGHLLRYACSYGYKLMGNYTNECVKVEGGGVEWGSGAPWCARRYNVPLPNPPTWSEWTTEWSQWTECDVTCGPGGVQLRERICLDGQICHGPAKEQRECKGGLDACPSPSSTSEPASDYTILEDTHSNTTTSNNNIDHCRSAPCWNGGKCTNLDGDAYKCDCVEGFRGDQCEEEITCWVPYYLNKYGIDVLLTPSGELPTESRVKYGQTIIYACHDVSNSVYGFQCAVCGKDGMLRRPYSTLYVRTVEQTTLPDYKICASIIAVPTIT